MSLHQLQRLGRRAWHASSLLFGVSFDVSAAEMPIDIRELEQRLRMAQSLAAPGFMALSAVRNGQDIVDFEWHFANAEAARLMRCGPDGLLGRRLVDVLEGRPGRVEVFDQYRRVVERGTARAVRHRVELADVPAVLRHAAVRLNDGVAVSVTNLTAIRREIALRQEIRGRAAFGSIRAD